VKIIRRHYLANVRLRALVNNKKTKTLCMVLLKRGLEFLNCQLKIHVGKNIKGN